jgi:hypothetical protein
MKHYLAVTIASIISAVSAAGQIATTTSLVGTITDPSGNVIANAAVTAVNTGTGDTYNTTTNEQGYYSIQFIRLGSYDLTVKQQGFQTFTKKGVHVDVNQIVRNDIQLQVGSVTETINVEAVAPSIKTDDASVSEIINERAVADLPLNGRDPLKLAITTPGVIQGMKATDGVPPGQDFIGAGTREIQNSLSLDGISILNNLITTTSMRPSVDSVQEVQVQTGTYSAQYGSYMGVQVNMITKSGTNNLHGSLAHFFRNDKLDARGFFENPANPKRPLRQNQFGIEIDGPVYIPGLYDGRDKTFFMGSYEGLRSTRQGSAQATVFTERMRQGDFSEVPGITIRNPTRPGSPIYPGNVIPAADISPVSRRILEYMPLPNRPGLITNNYLATVPRSNDTDQTVNRVDQNIGSSVRLFFRYAWQDTTYFTGSTGPYNGTTSPVRNTNWTAGYTHTITPRLVNDFRGGRMHVDTNSVNHFYVSGLTSAGSDLGIPGFDGDVRFDNPGTPDINITGFLGLGNGATNWFQDDTTWQASDQLSYTHGSHNFMMGGEFRKMITGRRAANSARGVFSFNSQLTGYAPADFMLGLPQSVTTPAPQIEGRVAQWRNGFFFLDNWQASRRLTLNIGLRYELPLVPYTVNGFATKLNDDHTAVIPPNPPQPGFKFINPNHKNFAPRFGFALRLTEKTVIRGGIGIYYNPNQTNTFTFLNTNPPFTAVAPYTATAASPTLSFANPTAGSQATPAPPNIITVGPDLPTPRMHQWSFSIARELWRNSGFELQYLGSHQLNLDRNYYVNTPLPGPGPVNSRRPNPRFSDIRWIKNDVIANYEGLTALVRQRFWNGLQFMASYTWSKTLDIGTDSNGGSRVMDPYNWRRDYGPANWDIPHRFVASYSYELPFFRGSTGPVQYVLGNWQLNGITILQSGFPFNVTLATDVANIGVSGSQRPDIVGNPVADCGSGRLTRCVDKSAFANPTQYTFGNAGRNILRGAKRYTSDFSLFKNFPFGERVRLQFRAEAFNLFNTPIFSNPNATFNPSVSGIADPFGSITSTALENREIQLALKLNF